MVIQPKKRGWFCLAFLLVPAYLQARDLGVVGTIFDIKEMDTGEFIQKKLRKMDESGELALHQNTMLANSKIRLRTPLAVAGLQVATKYRKFNWDPSIQLKEDIKDHQNRLIHAKGKKINPLMYVRLRGQWLFFNGDDPKHQDWAKNRYKTGDKLILVRGSPVGLMKDWQLPVYFDQSGYLVRKLGIQQIPACVHQENLHLMVEEIPIEGDRS